MIMKDNTDLLGRFNFLNLNNKWMKMNKLVILKIIQISLMINFIRQAMKIRIVLEIKEVILKN